MKNILNFFFNYKVIILSLILIFFLSIFFLKDNGKYITKFKISINEPNDIKLISLFSYFKDLDGNKYYPDIYKINNLERKNHNIRDNLSYLFSNVKKRNSLKKHMIDETNINIYQLNWYYDENVRNTNKDLIFTVHHDIDHLLLYENLHRYFANIFQINNKYDLTNNFFFLLNKRKNEKQENLNQMSIKIYKLNSIVYHELKNLDPNTQKILSELIFKDRNSLLKNHYKLFYQNDNQIENRFNNYNINFKLEILSFKSRYNLEKIELLKLLNYLTYIYLFSLIIYNFFILILKIKLRSY